MMNDNDALRTTPWSARHPQRWWRYPSPRRADRLPAWRLALRVSLILVASAGLITAAVSWLMEPLKVEPPFNRIVGRAAGPVKEFSLRDVHGGLHTLADWTGRSAIVLFFIATECPVSNGYAPEMARLARQYGPRSVLFLGIHCDPDLTAQSAASHATEFGLPFPILLDPNQR